MPGFFAFLLLLQMYPAAPVADSNLVFTQPVLKSVPPQVFIFKPGAGPYDRVAAEFVELVKFMAENKMPGQLAAVFYDDPAKVPAESLRWEAGVITNQPPLHTEPYTQKIISGRKAAALMVDGLPGQNRERYATMLGFIRQRRYFFKPPAMEILLQPAGENAEAKTEILLPVQLLRRGK
ncbi:MAG: GyrI-like domain-containing protein [candidate division Zixibacteria bacterium]|nr:GyrI-like domain-containing protein [candidate division Zixibacteria bacterium]